MPRRKCQGPCKRTVGTLQGRNGKIGKFDTVKLGPLEKCDQCGLWACPDCHHEGDCCLEAEWEAECNEPAPTLF